MPVDSGLLHTVALPLLEALERATGMSGRRPLLLLNGPVGAGKTHLGRLLEERAAERDIRLVVLSIDDLYLPWPERRRVLAGNPFGVWRVPPGSHDVALLMECLAHWRDGGVLRTPRFDKTLAEGQGDRSGWRRAEADAVVIEGWLMGARPLGSARLAEALPTLEVSTAGAPLLSAAEQEWLPRWDRNLENYVPLWRASDGLWLLRPTSWTLPRRWRFQAEARQRRAGGGWLPPAALERLVRASLCSLPPSLYQDPLLQAGGGPPLLGAAVLDGRRRCRTLAQSSDSSAVSSIG